MFPFGARMAPRVRTLFGPSGGGRHNDETGVFVTPEE
jgi:hypothetical protein